MKGAPTKFEPINFDAIRAAVNLHDLVTADLGASGRSKRWPCPFHGGEHDNLSLTPDGRHFKCWSCGESGDVFDYLAKRENVTVAEAARRLDPSAGINPAQPISRPAAVAPPRHTTLAAWQDPDWQSAVDAIVREAEAALWTRDGRPALDWLRARGLEDHTIRRFKLGFNPRDLRSEPLDVLGVDRENRPQGLYVRRGITIPWVRPGSWYQDPGPKWVGVNVRRLTGDFQDPKPKYWALSGSERGHGYPWPEASAIGEPALLCEGEFDALIAWQELGWVANIVTFGGAGQRRETDDARAFLAVCPDWLLMFDQDDAGDTAARAMIRKQPHRCRRLILPEGVKDLNELHRSGSVLGWLSDEYARFGWPWPLRVAAAGSASREAQLAELAP
jgi:DNA primase